MDELRQPTLVVETDGDEVSVFAFKSRTAAELFVEQFEGSDVSQEIVFPRNGESALIDVLSQDEFFSNEPEAETNERKKEQ